MVDQREVGYFIGFYIGDGNLFIKKEKGIWRIRFYLSKNENKISNKLTEILRNLGKKSVRIYEDRKNCLIVECFSKKIVELINRFAKNKILLNVDEHQEDFLKGIIEGLIDSDGYVYRFGKAEIKTSNEELKNQIKETL